MAKQKQTGGYEVARVGPGGKPASRWTLENPGKAQRLLNHYHDLAGAEVALSRGEVLRCGNQLVKRPGAKAPPPPEAAELTHEQLVERVGQLEKHLADELAEAEKAAKAAQAVRDAHDAEKARADELAGEVKALKQDADWAWTGDGTDDLESMSEAAVVRITAGQLRALLAPKDDKPTQGGRKGGGSKA